MLLVHAGGGFGRTVSWLLIARLVAATTAVVSAGIAIHGWECCVVMSRQSAAVRG